MKKISKTWKVAKHLRDFGSITSWEAIEQYGATRLSAIIYNLKKIGWEFEWEDIKFQDRYGDENTFRKYILRYAPPETEY